MRSLSFMLCSLLPAVAAHGDPVLVQPSELGAIEGLLMVDARSAGEYEAGHIPGAVLLGPDDINEDRGNVKNELRPRPELMAVLAQRGVNPAKHIVVYGNEDVKEGARVFWALEYLGYPQVAFLNGGWNAWLALGNSPAEGAQNPGVLSADALGLLLESEPDKLATKDEVKTALATGNAVVADVRDESYYNGSERKDYVAKAGHIPGAVNTPAEKALDGGRILTDGLPHEADKPVITYCNSGMSGSVGYLIRRALGNTQVSVYDGSMSEWALSEEVISKDN